MTVLPANLTLSRDDRPIFIAALFIVAILIAGTAYTWQRFGSAPLLSPNYLLQQLQIGAFLGIVAAGMMIVILISQIDLSVPWTLTAAAMMATAVGGAWAYRSVSRSALWSALSTVSASPICECPR